MKQERNLLFTVVRATLVSRGTSVLTVFGVTDKSFRLIKGKEQKGVGKSVHSEAILFKRCHLVDLYLRSDSAGRCHCLRGQWIVPALKNSLSSYHGVIPPA